MEQKITELNSPYSGRTLKIHIAFRQFHSYVIVLEMRLWSIHPMYLDRAGLLAVWREGLLAQKVLRGLTKGYRNHPQLERFKRHKQPLAAIAAYLRGIRAEALRRGYKFDAGKIGNAKTQSKLRVTDGQIAYERKHLLKKLHKRAPALAGLIATAKPLRPHPFFAGHPGPVENWEKYNRKG